MTADLDRAGHWKHEWIPLDPVAAKEHYHGHVPAGWKPGSGGGERGVGLPKQHQDAITAHLKSLRVESGTRGRYNVVNQRGELVSRHPDRAAAQQAIKGMRPEFEAQAHIANARTLLGEGDTIGAGKALDAADKLTKDPAKQREITNLMQGMTFNPGQYRKMPAAKPPASRHDAYVERTREICCQVGLELAR